MSKDMEFMKRALELARGGWGKTNPNPLVGAVIVKDGEIVAEGFHEVLGGSHAEAAAFNNAKGDVSGASMYVNLEPCSHYGRTPPCANKIIEKGIKRVVIGMVDPNPRVSGRGIDMLRNAGVEVTVGVMEDESKKLNEIFIKYIAGRKPFVIMKTAMTLDGKIAAYSGDSKWITCESSRRHVHTIRDRVAAVMVGINTVLKDNPFLTTRLVNRRGNDAVRIVVDSRGLLPLECNLINVDSPKGVILATTASIDGEKQKQLEDKGVKIILAEGHDGKVDLKILMDELLKLEIDSILLEGGGGLNASALEYGIVDKVMFFIAPKIIGGKDALTPVEGVGAEFVKDGIKLKNINIERFEDDILVEGYLT